MKCPHCLESFHDAPQLTNLIVDGAGDWIARHQICPECGRAIIQLINGRWIAPQRTVELVKLVCLVYPRGVSRTPLGPEVPKEIAEDYREASMVASDSPKASAALSRRCLQQVLRTAGGVRAGNLSDEIQQVIDAGKLPSHILESIDAIRNIGNFSAHPMKSMTSGEILPVEPHEAEWNLDVLESLFDFYFVQPAKIARKRAELDAKLNLAGKPPMK